MRYSNFLHKTILVGAMLLTCSVLATAQIVFKPRVPNDRVVVPQQPPPDVAVNRNAVYGTVTGTISWPKVIGKPPMYPGASDEYAVPCGLFVVLAKSTVGHQGSFGQFEVVGRGHPRPVESNSSTPGGTYSCSYEINGLPKDTSLVIAAEFIDTRMWETEPWLSIFVAGGRTGPPAGKVRVFTGGGGVTLTNAQPVVTIDFGIRYAPAASVPR